MEDGWDEEGLEDSELIRRMVIVDLNLDEIGWVKFWGREVSFGHRLGPSRADFANGSVEKGWYK